AAMLLADGRLPTGDYCWPMRGTQIIAMMQRAGAVEGRQIRVVNAVATAWRQFIDELCCATLIAVGIDAMTGDRWDLGWGEVVACKFVDVRAGSLLAESSQGEPVVRWREVEVREPRPPATEVKPVEKPAGKKPKPQYDYATKAVLALYEKGYVWKG